MKNPSLLATLVSVCLVGAGAMLSSAAAIASGDAATTVRALGDGQLEFDLSSGDYVCEWGLRVNVERGASAPNQIQIGWNGGQYQLDRDPSFSGLPRFEDRTNGLVWIDLPWKGVLLDGKTYKPLANDCKTA